MTLVTTGASLLPPATVRASLICRSTTIGRSFSFSVKQTAVPQRTTG
ncbi:unnamed protein product [Brassica rapa subsp. narinosa]